MKILILFALIICLFYSCQDANNELIKLQIENQKLRLMIKEYKKKYNYSPKIFPQKKIIKLGERYQAIITLSTEVGENEDKVKILLGQYKNNVFTPIHIDTLQFNQGSIYSLTPKDTGIYKWGGTIFLLEDGKTKQYSFTESFQVK